MEKSYTHSIFEANYDCLKLRKEHPDKPEMARRAEDVYIKILAMMPNQECRAALYSYHIQCGCGRKDITKSTVKKIVEPFAKKLNDALSRA